MSTRPSSLISSQLRLTEKCAGDASTSEQPLETPVTQIIVAWVLMLPLWSFACNGIPWFRNGTSDSALIATFGTLGGSQGGTADNVFFATLLFTVLPVLFFSRLQAMRRAVFRDKLFLCIAVLILLSSMWSQFPIVSLEWSPIALINIATAFYLHERFSPEQQIQLIYILGWICLVFSYYLVFTTPSYGLEHADLSLFWRGMYAQKNMCSMTTTFLMSAAFYVKKPTILLKVLSLIYIVLSLVLIIQTHSATGKIALASLAAFYIAIKVLARLNARIRGIFILATLVLGVTIAAAAYFLSAEIAVYLGRDATLTGRTLIWSTIIPSISKRPLLGYGYHAFWRGYQGESASISVAANWAVPSAHNGILEIWVSLGAVGVVLLLFSLLRASRDAFRTLTAQVTPYVAWYSCLLFLMIVINVDEAAFFDAYGLLSMLYVFACLGLARQAKALHEART